MKRDVTLYTVRSVIFLLIFGIGYLCGSVTQRNADAQLGEIGSDMMKKATGSGGTIGNVAKLGTTIADIEKHVNGLQQNLDTLKAVKAALGGIVK